MWPAMELSLGRCRSERIHGRKVTNHAQVTLLDIEAEVKSVEELVHEVGIVVCVAIDCLGSGMLVIESLRAIQRENKGLAV